MAKILDHESLFSLELVVERLSLPNVVCRFPAIAFRLLDYPTLIIYHVEPDLADSIRSKIALDPYYKLPKQLPEFQDKQGDFCVKKGKSCLFKVTPNFFQRHLASTPLYVMIIDTYPEVPKLIGSCTIPLDMTMDKLCDDIVKLGISVPTVHGEKGEYKIYNLMGSEIGNIVTGHRLLSLGMGLMPHIPDHAIAKMGAEKNKTVRRSIDGKRAMETADIILEDIQAADKNIQVSVFAPVPKTDTQNIQTDIEMRQTTASQTEKKKKHKHLKHVQAERKKASHKTLNTDDIFITNTICPPPLFYNCEAAEPEVPLAQGLTFSDGNFVMAPFQQRIEQADSISDTMSESDTIRLEDRFSDSDAEDYVDFESSRIIKTEGKGPKAPIRKTLTKSSLTKTKSGINWKEKVASGTLAPGVFGNLTQFPILNTLMNEILALQGGGIAGGQPLQELLVHQGHLQSSPRRKSTPSDSVSPAGPDSQKDKENKEEFLARLATPRSGRQSHHVCAGGDDVITKNKGWIRKQPVYGVKKTKLLTCGLTNTQRLRLAKTNPKLLKTLEHAEDERRKLKGIPARREAGESARQAQVSGAPKPIKGSRPPVSPRTRPVIPPLGKIVDSSMEDTGDMRTSTDSKPHKRPVPTPRLSRQFSKGYFNSEEFMQNQGNQDDRDEYEQYLRQRMPSPEVPKRKNINKGLTKIISEDKSDRNSNIYDEPKSQVTSISKSIEVHLPNAAQDEDATDVEGSEIGDEERNGFGRTRTLGYHPGFPDEPATRDIESRVSHYTGYSDDFETDRPGTAGTGYSDDFETERGANSYSPVEPSFKKIEDPHSDDSFRSTEEPVLRKIVDQYSDDDKYRKGSSQRKTRDQYSHISDMGEEPILRKMVDHYSDHSHSGEEPTLRKMVDHYSDQSCSGEEPTLRKMVDHYSDKSESFHSAKSEESEDSDQRGPMTVDTADYRLRNLPSSLNPTLSTASPVVAVKQPNWHTTREPVAVAASSTTVDPGEYTQGGVSESYESTAYISRSQVPSVGTSLESTGDHRNWRHPRPSPRRTVERMSSIHTDSVSSYAPSDPENISPIGNAEEDYSDAFSDEDVTMKAKHISTAKVDSRAALGYTWT